MLSNAIHPIPRQALECTTFGRAAIRSRRKHGIVAATASSLRGEGEPEQRIIILGGGIAGLSTARYLLHHARRNEGAGIAITLIDKNDDVMMSTHDSPASSYEEQINRRPHFNIPSRRNGNYLCPSLTVPWTARPLWKEVILPGLKSAVNGGPRSPISFDWPSLIADRNMVRFFLGTVPSFSCARRLSEAGGARPYLLLIFRHTPMSSNYAGN
jgi:hypothetical protein